LTASRYLWKMIYSTECGIYSAFCVVFCRSLFVSWLFGQCVVCPSIYGFWLPLWYLQTLLTLQQPSSIWKNPFFAFVVLFLRYNIKLVSDLPQVCGFHWVLRCPPSIKLSAAIWLKYFERGVKHHKPKPNLIIPDFRFWWRFI